MKSYTFIIPGKIISSHYFSFKQIIFFLVHLLQVNLKINNSWSKKYFLKYFIYLFILERGEGREKEKDKNIDVREEYRSVALTGDQIRNPTVP